MRNLYQQEKAQKASEDDLFTFFFVIVFGPHIPPSLPPDGPCDNYKSSMRGSGQEGNRGTQWRTCHIYVQRIVGVERG